MLYIGKTFPLQEMLIFLHKIHHYISKHLMLIKLLHYSNCSASKLKIATWLQVSGIGSGHFLTSQTSNFKIIDFKQELYLKIIVDELVSFSIYSMNKEVKICVFGTDFLIFETIS